MSSGLSSSPALRGGKKWLPLVLTGILAVASGLVLPQLMGGVTPLPEPSAVPTDSLAYTPPTWPEAPDPRGMLLRLGLGTAFVLVLCVATILLSKRWLRPPNAAITTTNRLALVETLPLGNRCVVHLVRVGRQQVLVGVDGAGVKSLVALPELFEDALTQAETTEAPPPAPARAA